jgi:hypothetical protein
VRLNKRGLKEEFALPSSFPLIAPMGPMGSNPDVPIPFQFDPLPVAPDYPEHPLVPYLDPFGIRNLPDKYNPFKRRFYDPFIPAGLRDEVEGEEGEAMRAYSEGEMLPSGFREPMLPGELPPGFYDPNTMDPFYPGLPGIIDDENPYGPGFPSKPFVYNPIDTSKPYPIFPTPDIPYPDFLDPYIITPDDIRDFDLPEFLRRLFDRD